MKLPEKYYVAVNDRDQWLWVIESLLKKGYVFSNDRIKNIKEINGYFVSYPYVSVGFSDECKRMIYSDTDSYHYYTIQFKQFKELIKQS